MLTAGTGASNAVQLDGSAKLPAVDGSQLTNLPSSYGPVFSAYRSTSDQSITSSVWTKVQIQAEEFDPDSFYDSVTNYRFQPTKSGYYLVTAKVEITASSPAPTLSLVAIYKNGTVFKRSYSSTDIGTSISALIYLNGSTDYLEEWAWSNGGTFPAISFGPEKTFFQASFIRS